MPQSDNQLEGFLSRSGRIEPEILAQIHDRFFPEVYHYVCFRVGDEQAGYQLASDVFHRLLASVQRRRAPRKNLHSWLINVAFDVVNEYIRQNPDSRALSLTGLSAEPVCDATSDDRRQILMTRQALARLPLEQQHILALRFTEDRTLDDIAQILAKPIATVKDLQLRALAFLHRCVNDERAGQR